MLSVEDIELHLGRAIVDDVEEAIRAAFAVADRSEKPIEAAEAVRSLLVSMLAAATITPIDGAEHRSQTVAADFLDLINCALAETSRRQMS